MAFLSWPNQEPLVCPLAYINLMMTLPTFNAHLEAPLLCLVGKPCPFQSLERREVTCHKLERERERDTRVTPLLGGPLAWLVDFLALEGSPQPPFTQALALGFTHACSYAFFSPNRGMGCHVHGSCTIYCMCVTPSAQQGLSPTLLNSKAKRPCNLLAKPLVTHTY